VDCFSPLLEKLVDQFRNPTFTIIDQPNPNSYAFTTADGFAYGADHTKVSVAFQHRLKAKAISGGPPIMEMLSTPLPFTELLPTVSEKLVAVTRMLPEISMRKAFRVGVVSSTSVALEDVPPGISRMIEYMGRPWGGATSAFQFVTTTRIATAENWTDSCQHTLVRSEDPEKLLALSFDFHRTFNVGQATTEASLKTLLSKCSEADLNYFEDLAEGNRFDEHIISKAS
jgi:hypothetical protein